MNKRIFTMMTIVLMVGALFSNLYAQGPAEAANGSLEAGKMYYLGDGTNYIKAKVVKSATASSELFAITPDQTTTDIAEASLFTLEIKNVGGKDYFQFKTTAKDASENLFTGYLSVKNDGTVFPNDPTDDDIKAALFGFVAVDPYVNGTGIQLLLNGVADKALKADGTMAAVASAGEVKFYLPDNAAMDISKLNSMFGNGFSLKLAAMTPAVEKNPLTESSIIQAVNISSSAVNDVNTTDGAVYLKVGGENFSTLSLNSKANIEKFSKATFIVLDTIPLTADNSSKFNGTKGVGFQLTTVKGSELITATSDGVNVDKAYNKRWANNGQFVISNNVNRPDSLIIELPKVYLPDGSALASQTSDGPVRLSVVNFNKKNILTTYYDATTADAVVPERWTLIKFGSSNIVKQKELVGVVNIISLKNATQGQVYGPLASLMDSALIQLGKPEGQFIVTSTADGMFTFTNRETGETVALHNLRHVEKDVYATSANDTLKIIASKVASKYDGFKNYSADELNNTVYNLSIYSAVTENVFLMEKHSDDHLLGLSKDKADAANFKLVKFEEGATTSHSNDSIIKTHTLSYLKDGKYATDKTDSLVIFSYALYNEANGEFLSYDGDKEAYYCNPDVKTLDQARNNNVVRFVIKEKKNGRFNLVIADVSSSPSIDKNSLKLYGAFSENKVNQTTDNMYKPTDNDLFLIEQIDAPEYRTVAFLDTLSIYKNGNANIRLYERNSFLGMQHIADVEKMAPAMVADTAYYTRNPLKPQYLLLVRPEYIYHNESCGNPAHPSTPSNVIDTVKGYFLVNLIDSAKAWGNKHDNPYIWDNYAKLAFVKGYHANDTLVILRDKQVKGDSIAVGADNTNKIGKYAFRYVDRDEKSFIIETSFDGTGKTGYIKWLNGTPVVVDNIREAEVFNMNEDEPSAPTANEKITTDKVTVTTARGAVIVKNAAGKSVLVSNMLGKVIVRQILSSDNERIAVPAGIKVVAVEGETAVKALVE